MTQGKQGYRVPDRTNILEGFTGDFEGLEVTCDRNSTVDLYLELSDALEDDRITETFELFGEKILLSWNLEDSEGRPVPATGAALRDQPVDLAILIVRTWLTERTAVSAPLERPSTNGLTEVEPPLDLGSMSTPNS